ncbi:MAG: hypothetical protein GYB36_13120 [Alphaproteobacteria bacterium]|nr:hypothetical protein [Alphaproteobacteria bacterium]
MIRALNAIAFLVAVALAVALYIAKTEAKTSQERLASIQAQLQEERRSINMLNIEIASLEEPERLRMLARRYLGFEPLDPSREIELYDLPLLVDEEEREQLRRDLLVVNQDADGQMALAEPQPAGGGD